VDQSAEPVGAKSRVRCQNSVQGPDQVFLIELGCSPVLVDQSAEDSVMADRGIERDHGGGVVAGWVLVESLVRPVVVEMALVVVKDGTSVSFVIDQQPIGALGADAADEPLGIAIGPHRQLHPVPTIGIAGCG
jgi:hypothetical protein